MNLNNSWGQVLVTSLPLGLEVKMAQDWENESNDPKDFEIKVPQVQAVKNVMDRIFAREEKKERRRRARAMKATGRKHGKATT